MKKFLCDRAMTADPCHWCTHAAKHDRVETHRKPTVICDIPNFCEATGKMVSCQEVEE